MVIAVAVSNTTTLWASRWLTLFLSLIVATIQTRTSNQGIVPKYLWKDLFYLPPIYLVWVAVTIKTIDKIHEKSNPNCQLLFCLTIWVCIC